MSRAQIGEPEPYTTFNPYTAISANNDYHDDVAKQAQQTQDADQKSESEKRFSESNLPEVVPADVYEQGKEVVHNENFDNKEATDDRASEKEKQAAFGAADKETAHVKNVLPEAYHQDVEQGKETFVEDAAMALPSDGAENKPVTWKEKLDRRKVFGIKLKWALLGLAIVILMIIVLGAGLGAGLSIAANKASHQHEEATSGALQGTKLAIVSQSFGSSSEQTLVLYYQHNTGSIRWMQLASNGSWVPGDPAHNLVANDAKSGTPITAVSYNWSGQDFWRIYYVDFTNMIREVWGGNATESWALGPLNNNNFQPLDATDTGMVACWAGSTDGGEDVAPRSEDLVIRLAYASDAETFRTVVYTGVDQLYNTEQTLSNLNGHSSPTCYDDQRGTVDYMMLLDLEDNVNVYWRDSNTSSRNSSSHPIDQWTNSNTSIANFDPSASLAFTGDTLYAQGKFDKLMGGYSITFDAEDTAADSDYAEFALTGNPGVPGSGLTGITDADGNTRLYFQTGGGDILEYTRASSGGAWSGSVIDIPFD